MTDHKYSFYKPYKNNTQKAVNNSLRFDSSNLEWMDVANIIINTKNQEFFNIIEFYRENHKKAKLNGMVPVISR